MVSCVGFKPDPTFQRILIDINHRQSDGESLLWWGIGKTCYLEDIKEVSFLICASLLPSMFNTNSETSLYF